jgi:hypothetical protein
MAGYTRQAAANIANGSVIDAADLNSEYNAIESAFATDGHSHDGTSGNGPRISVMGPAGQLVVETGVVRPNTDNTVDLGTSSVEFKDAYFDGTVKTDILTVDATSTFTGDVTASANVDVSGDLTVTGDATINGNLTFGNAADDSVTFGADIDSSIIPNTDDTYDLGSTTKEWRNLYLDGTAYIDSLEADTADINGGSIDGAVIGATTTAAITGTTITGTSLVGPLTGNVTGTVSDISNHDTDDLSEGTTNQYYTDARAQAAITVTDAGGDGSLAYSGGTLTYTGPSASEVRAHFSAGEGIDISSGAISAEDATETNKGIASFDGTDFTVTSGDVTLNTERVQDIVGAMVTGNTESGVSVTYQDGDGTLDFAVNNPTITLAGDLSGSATMTNLGNVSITAVVADDSHNHVISNVDGLQTSLDAKAALAGANFTGAVDVNATLTANKLALDNGSTDWSFEVDASNNLRIKYGTATLLKLDTNGNLTVPQDITGLAGTIT